MTTHKGGPGGTDSVRFDVLVVDDDAAALTSIAAVLGDDVNVVACSTPQGALDLLRTRSFHVICSDYRMPGMDGYELLRRVSELPEYVSCLLLTGSPEYSSQESAKYYTLLKPFDPQRLIGIVLQLGRVAEMKRSVRQLRAAVAPR
jgi:CheY-like chemotaxis protein